LFCFLLGAAATADAQVSVGIGFPGVSIGINVPVYPELVPVPGYPVYYGPGMNSNYFFYDGMYWVYEADAWYASSWYNGPWGLVAPEAVPSYLLMVPVRYYRQPPQFFIGWQVDASPRWGEHWGRGWEQRRSGWDRVDRNIAPAPLPVYQRQYAGDRYPRGEQQREIQTRNDHYQPRDPQVRRQVGEQGRAGEPSREAPSIVPGLHLVAPEAKSNDRSRPAPASPPAAQRQPSTQERGQASAPRVPSPQERQAAPPRAMSAAPVQNAPQPQREAVAPHQPLAAAPQQARPEARETRQEPGREGGREGGHEKPEDRGQDRH
jgi:hypothetical protein